MVAPLAAGRCRRILLVEDHPDTLRMMSRLLEAWGLDVVSASGAYDALGKEGPFDMALIDISLPDLNGMELLRRLRQRADLPAIAVTGHAFASELQRFHDAGFKHIVTKPVNFDELARAIEEACDAPDKSPTLN